MSKEKYSVTLDNLDVIFLVDRSGSMSYTDGVPTGQARWQYAEEFIRPFVTELGAYDQNGVDLVFFNDRFDKAEGVTPDSFAGVWKSQKPNSGTYMAPPLKWALDLAASRWSDKPQLLVVLTDGQPSDKNNIAQIIIDTTQKMNADGQCAILFLQVGDDPDATKFLTGLDDDLERRGAKFDIVDRKFVQEIAGRPIQEVVDTAFND